MIREIEKKIEETQNIDNVLEYGKRLESINPVDFEDVYSPEEIRKDLEHLDFVERKIENSKKKMNTQEREIYDINEKRSKAFEILLADQIYDGEWLGSEAMSIRASRFDDVLKGVDIVVEFDRESAIERIALVVDASTTSDIDYIEKKIKRNIRRISEDFRPLEIKYFHSQIRDENGEYFKGKIENLIPIVIGADSQNANRIFDIFSELIFLKNKTDNDSKERCRWLKKKLSTHPIQNIFLDQIEIQLEMYISILNRKNRPADDVEALLVIIKEVAEEKKASGFSTSGEVNGDATLNNIQIISQKYTQTKESFTE